MRATRACSEQKKPAGETGGFDRTESGAALRERFRNFSAEFHRMRVIAFGAQQGMAFLQHAIQFVDQHGNGLVAVIRLNGCIHVRSLNLDMTLGLELDSDRGVAITFQFNTHPDDALFMAKQSLGFLSDKRL